MAKRTPHKVLIVEDEPDLAMGLRDNLQFEGYEVIIAADGEAAIDRALSEQPRIVLLDIMLPKLGGFEVCRKLRLRGFKAPILMLTARSQEIDKVRGLELGADDYITKPFGVRELLARIKAALRRSQDVPPAAADFVEEEVKVGPARISFSKSRITRGRKEFPLGHYEAEILRILMNQPGQAVDRNVILKEIWGLENEPMNRSVDNHIVSLRRKIEEDPTDPAHILTVHGLGYKFVP